MSCILLCPFSTWINGIFSSSSSLFTDSQPFGSPPNVTSLAQFYGASGQVMEPPRPMMMVLSPSSSLLFPRPLPRLPFLVSPPSSPLPHRPPAFSLSFPPPPAPSTSQKLHNSSSPFYLSYITDGRITNV